MTLAGTTDNSVTVTIDTTTGVMENHPALERNLSSLDGLFHDNNARTAMLTKGDVRVYEVYPLDRPETSSELATGTSIVYPGKVGDEYFMTKGHFHTVLDTAETYLCLSGYGYMLMESPEGEWELAKFLPGRAVYVPGRYAHRSINISPDQPLITYFCFRADAGHDYATIETKGFRKLVVELNGKPEVIDNPRWNA